jgi:hypothetical protein
MKTRHLSAILLLALAAAVPALAKPNFTGDWKLNASKSEFGQMPPPSSMSQKISHEDPKLKSAVKQAGQQGEFEMESTYTTDGKENTNEVFGQAVKSTAKWEGDTLVIESKMRFGENDMTIVEKWTLSEDGKTLTKAQLFKSAMGEGQIKLVMEKQ